MSFLGINLPSLPQLPSASSAFNSVTAFAENPFSLGNTSRTNGWGTSPITLDSLSSFQKLGSALTQMASNETGYDFSKGQIGSTGGLYAADEILGGMNGSNAARHAAGVAGDAQIAAQNAANVLTSQTNQQNQMIQTAASSAAQGLNATAMAGSGAFNPQTMTAMAMGSGPISTGKLGGDTQNFLGV